MPTLIANKMIFNDLEKELKMGVTLKYLHVINLCVLEIFHVTYLFSKNVDIIEFATVEETVTSTMEALLRLAALCIHKKKYMEMYKTMSSHFWPSNAFGETHEAVHSKFSKTINMFSHINTASAFITMGVLLSLPMIHGVKEFPFKMWLPSWTNAYQSPNFEIICAWQWITNYWTVLFSILCYDYIYVMFAASVLNQLKMLRIAVKHVGSDEDDEVTKFLMKGSVKHANEEERMLYLLKTCVDHHCILQKFTSDIYSTYSTPFLWQFAATFNALCFSGYILISIRIDDIITIIHILTYIVVHLVEIFILLKVATEIHEQNLLVSDAAFESHWYKQASIKLRKRIILLIQRAQNTKPFKAGGVVECNLRGLMMIIRWSFSVITLLQKVE